MTKRILIADDHIMFAKGLKLSLEIDLGFTNLQSVTSCNRVLEELKSRSYTHLILDIGLSDGSAFEILPFIVKAYPHLKILICSGRCGVAYKTALLQFNVYGFLSKEDNEDDTKERLRLFLNGVRESKSEPQIGNPFSALSGREMEVSEYLIQGLGSDEIGDRLGIKQNTASTYKNRVFEKLGITNIRELIDLALIYKVT